MVHEMKNKHDHKVVIENLFERSWHFRNSEEFLKFFKFISGFHHYSRYNALLVYLQNDAVTFFGGISYWKNKFNRTVIQNAKPHLILAPKGPVMLVYDIMDTHGEETPEEFLEKGLGRKPFDVKGLFGKKDFQLVIEKVQDWGIDISFKSLSYFKSGEVIPGWTHNLEIVLKKKASNEINFATLIHELAHLFLGHTGHMYLFKKGTKRQTVLLNRMLSKSASELEAETVSYLVCKRLGLEKSSVEYLAAYIENEEEDLKQFEYELVVKTADKIEKMFLVKPQI